MIKQKKSNSKPLLSNSRFWILTAGIVLSVNIAGVVQLLIPGGSLQIIRMEQIFGFVSLFLLFIAIAASPITTMYENFPLRIEYLHARRAIGVLAFYYAALHSWLTFSLQLGGIEGVQYYSGEYQQAILLGLIGFVILFVMALTSFDFAVQAIGFKRWKMLHRLVYVAFICIFIHALIIGSHFEGLGFLSTVTGVLIGLLMWLEWQRLLIKKQKRAKPHD